MNSPRGAIPVKKYDTFTARTGGRHRHYKHSDSVKILYDPNSLTFLRFERLKPHVPVGVSGE